MLVFMFGFHSWFTGLVYIPCAIRDSDETGLASTEVDASFPSLEASKVSRTFCEDDDDEEDEEEAGLETVREGVTRVVVIFGFSGASPSLVNWVFPVDLGATRDEEEDVEDDDLIGASPSLANWVFVCLGATRDDDDDDDDDLTGASPSLVLVLGATRVDDDDDDLAGASPSLTNCVLLAGLGATREDDDDEDDLTGASPSFTNCVLLAGLDVPVVLEEADDDEDLAGASPSLANWVLPAGLGATRVDDDDDDDLVAAPSG